MTKSPPKLPAELAQQNDAFHIQCKVKVPNTSHTNTLIERLKNDLLQAQTVINQCFTKVVLGRGANRVNSNLNPELLLKDLK